MALNPLVDSRDVNFVLYEMLDVESLTKYPKFSEFDKDMFDDTLNLAETIAVNKVYPTSEEADKLGAVYEPDTKEVKVPECLREPLAALYEAGFGMLDADPEDGGMGMPGVMYTACAEYFTAASIPFIMYTDLSKGARNLITEFGTEEQKQTYVEKIMSGEWSGTMCLTEPEAGSDVGALKTKAVKQDDGTYLITGQKIFISAGENDLYGNIIHPVLARIEGDPAGTKGISIFIVSKYHVNSDGSCGEQNDVVCSGIEHKMGIKASATCTLNFGDNGKCVGYLLGEERKGMKIMFKMMNEARLFVSLQGQAVSSTAYMHAITYAKNRLQGRHVTQMLAKEAPSVPIVQHPDVKRMLLWMKAYVEGMRMLNYYTSMNIDLSHALDGEAQKEANAMVELLIPICKAGCTDLSWLVTAEAIQVYGGYGFCADYPVERFARDSKILSLYEGTNGIQSMDLTMRKILMNPEQYNFSVFKKKVEGTIASAQGKVDEKYIAVVQKGMEKLDEVLDLMKSQMGSNKYLELFGEATPLQQGMVMMVLAWLHLWSLTVSTGKMKELVGDATGADLAARVKDNIEAAFYTGRVRSSQFYLGLEFQKYFGKMDYIMSDESAVEDSPDEVFTGALEE